MIEDVLEILRRQLEFLLAQDAVGFFVQLGAYLDAIGDDPRIRAILEEMDIQAREALSEYDRRDAQMVDDLRLLRRKLVQVAPELDDSESPPVVDDPWKSGQTLNRFDQLARAPRENRFPNQIADRSDPSTSGKLLRILRGKVASNDGLEDLGIDLGNFERVHRHSLQQFLLAGRTLPGLSHQRLVWVRSELTPEPVHVNDTDELVAHAMKEVFSDIRGIRIVVFESGWGKDDVETAERHARWLSVEVRRLHEELVRRLYRNRSHRVLINRFKLRCESYDRERLRALTLETGRREGPLNAEAARFLFDNGLTPLISPEVGGLRPDVLPAGRWSFYVESKQYGGTSGRRTIRDGAYQIWDTAGVLRAAGLREVFWLVFRREGPRYVLPDELRADGIVVFPVHIDIAPLEETGSRQRNRPIEILAEELLPDRAVKAGSKRKGRK